VINTYHTPSVRNVIDHLVPPMTPLSADFCLVPPAINILHAHALAAMKLDSMMDVAFVVVFMVVFMVVFAVPPLRASGCMLVAVCR